MIIVLYPSSPREKLKLLTTGPKIHHITYTKFQGPTTMPKNQETIAILNLTSKTMTSNYQEIDLTKESADKKQSTKTLQCNSDPIAACMVDLTMTKSHRRRRGRVQAYKVIRRTSRVSRLLKLWKMNWPVNEEWWTLWKTRRKFWK